MNLIAAYGLPLNIIKCFFFQAEDGIRDVERSRGLGDVYKRQDYWGIFSISEYIAGGTP